MSQALREHSYSSAEDFAHRLLKLEPEKNSAWDRLVQAQCGQGHYKEAKHTLGQWRAIGHHYQKVEEYAGDIALSEKKPEEALAAWGKALQAAAGNLRVLGKVARLQAGQHRWSGAEASWTQMLRVGENAEALLQRAICRRHLHHWTEALADLHRAGEIAPNDPAVKKTADLFRRLSEFLPQIRQLDVQLGVSPKDAALLADGSLLFLRAGDYEMALEESQSAARFAPSAMRPRLFEGLALLGLGRAVEAQKRSIRRALRLEMLTPDFLETISRLDSEISVEKTNADLYAARAWQLNEIGQPALALQDADRAARLDPKSPGAAVEKGYALMKSGKSEEAFGEIARATSLDPNYATAWQYRGELEMERAKFEPAIESFSRSLSLNKTAAALQKREACFREMGLFPKAEQDREALKELEARDLH